jgi:hypothetical protein
MLAMLAVMLVLMKKFNINIENAAELSTYIKGGTFTVAAVIIAFTVIKSFALGQTAEKKILYANASKLLFDNQSAL